MRHISLFLILLLLQACGKKIASTPQAAPAVMDTLVIETGKDTIRISVPKPEIKEEPKVIIEDFNFNYLKAKSKIVWKTAKDQDTYTVDIRMKKDSTIWVNISQSGFTGATGLFTKDLVQFYQKINNEYYRFSYDSLSVKMGFKVDYGILQSLIVGNQPFKRNNSRMIRENENIILKQQEGRINIDNMVGPNRKLKKLLMNDVPTNNKMTMDFEEFTELNQVLFPFSSQINLDVKDKNNKNVNTLITIKYSKVELLDTPLEFPFRVPQKLLNPNK
jgi:hypothetical protein